MEVLIINGHDYSRFIERKGFSWSRNDLDGEDATRVKNGKMRRDKIAEKHKFPYSFMPMRDAELAQLDNDLKLPSFAVHWRDMHGSRNGEFYCTSLHATCDTCHEDDCLWTDINFSLIEV